MRKIIFILMIQVAALSFVTQKSSAAFQVEKIVSTDTNTIKVDTIGGGTKKDTVKREIYFQTPLRLSTASVNSISGKEIATTPVESFPLALQGRLPGLNISQTSGEPLNEGYSFLLRGQTPLVLIDGIPRSLSEIGMEEIESVTVLKDAVSTAMLGVRGSKGAILITTKKGGIEKPHVDVNVQRGFTQSTQNLVSKPLDAYNYALLYNEALTNDGLPTNVYGFNQQSLDGFKNGSDPIRYPNVNWADQILKNNASVARYNISTSGGNQYVRYFVSLEHFSQDGILKTSDINKYSTNSQLRGYFARSNADLQLSKTLSGGIYIEGRILNTNSPGNLGTANLFSALTTTPNSAYPIYNTDSSYGGTANFQNNIMAQSVSSGYSSINARAVLSDFYLKKDLESIAKGLWIKARVSFFSNLREQITRNKSFAVFQEAYSNNNTPQYLQYGTNGVQANSNAITLQNRSDFQELSFGYSHDSRNSGIDATLVANRDNLISGSDLAYTIQGISGHAAYNYQKKYLAEISFAYNGANRYPNNGGFRYGFFPALGLGWNIKQENFMSHINWLDNLKVYGSYGKTGNDNAYYFLYQQVYNATPTSIFGSSAGAAATVGESYLANLNPTWEKANKLNIGIQSSLFKKQLDFSIEYYNNKFYDLSIVRGTSNGLLGISYPSENIGQQKYYGLETEITWSQQKRNYGYHISANASFQQSKLLYEAEAMKKYSWMNETGQPVGMQFGYVAEGLFQNAQEIADAPTIEGYTPQPGDIKYKDLNGDGVINQYDQKAIGNGKPNIFYGINMGFNFKGFDFSILFQGMANRQVLFTGADYWEFQNSGTGQAFQNQLNRWTPATAATATYPRLSTGMGPNDGSVNNWITSTYWLRNANYIRLKTIELGYNISPKYCKTLGISSARFFLNALNPATWSSKNLNHADPENYSGAYPIQKVYTIGIKVQL